jgi:hypothetical protein
MLRIIRPTQCAKFIPRFQIDAYSTRRRPLTTCPRSISLQRGDSNAPQMSMSMDRRRGWRRFRNPPVAWSGRARQLTSLGNLIDALERLGSCATRNPARAIVHGDRARPRSVPQTRCRCLALVPLHRGFDGLHGGPSCPRPPSAGDAVLAGKRGSRPFAGVEAAALS